MNRGDLEAASNPGFLSFVTAVIVTRSDAFRVVQHSSENNGREWREDARSLQESGFCHSKSPHLFS
jgi:hypothetical protein